MKTRVLIAAALLAASVAAEAANQRKNFRVEQNFPLRHGGALVVENPIGNVEIIGTDNPGAETAVMKIVIGVDDKAIEEGRQSTALIVGGDDRTRILRTAIPPLPSRTWSSRVNWRIKVPKSTHVRVITTSGDHVHVKDILGNVIVKNVNGRLILENTPAQVSAESVNGNIIYSTARPTGAATLSTVNGDVEIRVQQDADFRFVAETVRGDIITNLPARGAFFGTTFRGSVNAPGGPTISAGTLMGDVQLLAIGPLIPTESLKSKHLGPPEQAPPRPVMGNAVRTNVTTSKTGAPEVRHQMVNGAFKYTTTIGNVRIDEVRGDADIFTGAGEVQLGEVAGTAKVISNGGPLQLGEVHGRVIAQTRAGDIFVDSARRGGELFTRGGTIRLLYTSGPTRLISFGGNINVRQAAGPIDASTKSGDVFVTMDGNTRSHPVTARSEKGNVVIHVGSGFGADVSATILTSDPSVHTIVSDVPGLSISREQVGDKTRIRATGRINGGGEPMELEATDGGIRITTGPVGATVIPR